MHCILVEPLVEDLEGLSARAAPEAKEEGLRAGRDGEEREEVSREAKERVEERGDGVPGICVEQVLEVHKSLKFFVISDTVTPPRVRCYP